MLMKDMDKKHEFIRLRAKEWSFERISKKIGVSKPTLINWNKDFEHEIKNMKSVELESLYEEYNTTTKQRLENYANLHKKVLNELKNRDLSDVKSDKLIEMLINITNKIEEIKKQLPPEFKTEEEILREKSKISLSEGSFF